MPISTPKFTAPIERPEWCHLDDAGFQAAVAATPDRFPAAEPDHTHAARKPPIRAKTKAAQWAEDIQRTWGHLTLRAATPEQQTALATLLEQTLEGGPDFAKVRRSATFGPIPVRVYSKEVAREIIRQAREIERETYPGRAKGEHGGALGRMALRLLEWFCFVMWPKSRFGMFPSLKHIAAAAQMSSTSVVEASKTLEQFGLLTIYHRRMRVQTALGAKVVQTTNAYVLNLVNGLGELALSIFRKNPREKSSDFSEFNRRSAIKNEHNISMRQRENPMRQRENRLPEAPFRPLVI